MFHRDRLPVSSGLSLYLGRDHVKQLDLASIFDRRVKFTVTTVYRYQRLLILMAIRPITGMLANGSDRESLGNDENDLSRKLEQRPGLRNCALTASNHGFEGSQENVPTRDGLSLLSTPLLQKPNPLRYSFLSPLNAMLFPLKKLIEPLFRYNFITFVAANWLFLIATNQHILLCAIEWKSFGKEY